MSRPPNEMPAIVNAIPEGLLSLLWLKQTGRNPRAMAEFIQPTMDLTAWYAASTNEVVASNTATRAALGSVATDLVVPQTEVWIVDSLVLWVQAAAGVTTCVAQGSVQATNGLGTFQLYAGPTVSVPAGSSQYVQLVDRSIMLRPGDTVTGTLVNYAGAGNVTFQAQARIARLLL